MTAMTEHTIKAFDAELQDLGRIITEMGGLAERQISEALEALNRQDPELAATVVDADARVDALQREAEEKAIATIARRQPLGVDLRDIVGALRVSNDLERIGDLAKNIAKRVQVVAGDDTDDTHAAVMRGIEHMATMALSQIKDVLDAYARRDSEKALQVWRSDGEIDAVNNSLFRELLTYMMEDQRKIGVCIHLMFCAKNIERMGDHATNIAETIYYMVEGHILADERPKSDTTASTRLPYLKD